MYISQLVSIGRICDNFFEQFNVRHYKLTTKLIKQGFLLYSVVLFKKVFQKSFLNILWENKYDVSQHIQEGICLLVTVRVDLA